MAAAKRTVSTAVDVTVRGDVPADAVEYAEAKIARVMDYTDEQVLRAAVVLSLSSDPAVPRRAHAEGTLDLSGTTVRAHAAAGEPVGAVDLLEARLRRSLLQHKDRARTRSRWIGLAEEGSWRHGDLPTTRQASFPRPPEERQVLRRKTFAVTPLTHDEAAYEMDLLGHDFYLFTEEASGKDAVVHRDGSGYRVSTEAPELTEAEAIERLGLSGEPFLLHTDPETGRGRVLYLRYDGHYGLIVPSNE
jgi:ribosome-associated translation inhibitor RaiA